MIGRPFPKGTTGNPSGRPKGLARYVREIVGDDGRKIADYMASVLEDEQERTETRMKAAQWLADRGWGRPIEQVEASIDPDDVVDLSTLTSAELAEMRNRLRRPSPMRAAWRGRRGR